VDNVAAPPGPDDSPARTSTRPPAAEPPDAGSGPDPVDGATAGPAVARRRRIGVLLSIAAGAYVLDTVSKILVVAKLADHAPIKLIGTFVELTYTRNSGAAFSVGVGYTVVFSLIAVGVIVAIARVSRSLYSLPWAIALGLLLGGAVGNLTDRIVRSPGFFRGWVVDFIQVPHFAIFNLADSAISVGGVLMVLLAFRGLHPDGTDERPARTAAPDSRQPAAAEETDAAGQPAAVEEPAAAVHSVEESAEQSAAAESSAAAEQSEAAERSAASE
jgi:signal peptidase II